MKTIQIEDDLLIEIEKRTGLGTFSHSEVIRKLFTPSMLSSREAPKPEANGVPADSALGIGLLLESSEYKMLWNAIDRYLAIFTWLHKTRPDEFKRAVEQFHRGKRTYFGRTREEVESSGKGNIVSKPIPNSPFWTLATLDNDAKKKNLRKILSFLNFSDSDISRAIETIDGLYKRQVYDV